MNERCDTRRCGARAYVKFENPECGYDLVFCAHHTGEYLDNLALAGFMITEDEREDAACHCRECEFARVPA